MTIGGPFADRDNYKRPWRWWEPPAVLATAVALIALFIWILNKAAELGA